MTHIFSDVFVGPVSLDKVAPLTSFIVTDGEEYSTCEIYERISYYLNKNIPKYRIPRFLFYFLGFLSTNLKIKIEKIISNECYTSEKIESLGFKAKHSFRDIHEEIV